MALEMRHSTKYLLPQNSIGRYHKQAATFCSDNMFLSESHIIQRKPVESIHSGNIGDRLCFWITYLLISSLLPLFWSRKHTYVKSHICNRRTWTVCVKNRTESIKLSYALFTLHHMSEFDYQFLSTIKQVYTMEELKLCPCHKATNRF